MQGPFRSVRWHRRPEAGSADVVFPPARSAICGPPEQRSGAVEHHGVGCQRYWSVPRFDTYCRHLTPLRRLLLWVSWMGHPYQ